MHLCIFFYLQLYGEAGMEGDKGRDYKKEFFFDYSYWSADPKDGHFIKQEQVKEGIVWFAFTFDCDFSTNYWWSTPHQVMLLLYNSE